MATNIPRGGAVVLICAILAGCSGGNDTGKADSNANNSGSSEPSASISQIAQPGAPDSIAVEIDAATQFDSGCMLNPKLTNPSGEAFTLYADIGGRRGDSGNITSLIGDENSLTINISAYTETGAQIGPTSLSGRCEVLDIVIGNIRCREGVGVEGEIGPCPLPVSFTISGPVRSLELK